VKAKLMSRVVVDSATGCWLWTGGKTKDGYGLMAVPGTRKLVYVHRLAFELFNRELASGECALHKCDVRNCVRPDHLFGGTRTDNAADKVAKGRQRGKVWATCKRGHEWTPENTGHDWRGDRFCRICSRAGYKRRRQRAKQ
jgi:hypothetical protein